MLSHYHLGLHFTEKWCCWNLFLHLLAVYVYSSGSCLFMLLPIFPWSCVFFPQFGPSWLYHGAGSRVWAGSATPQGGWDRKGFNLLSFTFSLRTSRGLDLTQPFPYMWFSYATSSGLIHSRKDTFISGLEQGGEWLKADDYFVAGLRSIAVHCSWEILLFVCTCQIWDCQACHDLENLVLLLGCGAAKEVQASKSHRQVSIQALPLLCWCLWASTSPFWSQCGHLQNWGVMWPTLPSGSSIIQDVRPWHLLG